MAVKIVTDTGCDLPPSYIEQYDITLVPLILRFGDRDVPDTPEARPELWQRVEARLPCDTSGPSIGAYEAVYGPLVEAGHDVVCIALTSAHSVTYSSAWAAAQAFPGKVTVIDSKSLSVGYGLQVLAAARAAAAGADMATVVDIVADVQRRCHLFFFLEQLDQVKRGGRLDSLMPILARLGTALNVRAILTINSEGRISLVGPARGRRGAIKRLVEEAAAAAPVETLAVGHVRCADEANALADDLAATLNFPRNEILVFEIGSVLIAHAGAGTLGVVALERGRG